MSEPAADERQVTTPDTPTDPAATSQPDPWACAELALDVVRATDVDTLLRAMVVAVGSVTGLRRVTVALHPTEGRPGRLARTGEPGEPPALEEAPGEPAARPMDPATAPAAPVRRTGAAAALHWRTLFPGSGPVRCSIEVDLLLDGVRRGSVYAADDRSTALRGVDDAALTTLTGFAAAAFGHLERLRVQRLLADRETAAETERERERMRTQFLARVIDAQEAERARVARDLHDQIGQSLTSVLLGLHLVDAAVSGETVVPLEAARQTAEVRDLVADALRDVRRLAFDLRPTLLDDVGLVAALHRLTTDLESRYQTTVDISVHGLTDDVRLAPEVETVTYRVVQESLTNVVRHSGAARVTVRIEHREGALRAVVVDDGVGFDPKAVRTSLGLRGMEERAALVGGSLVLDSAPGRGTTVTLEIPLG